MNRVSRRQFMATTGAATLSLAAGCLSDDSETNETQNESEEPEEHSFDYTVKTKADDVPTDFVDVLHEGAYHQAGLLNHRNERLNREELGEDKLGKIYDPNSVVDTVYSGGVLQDSKSQNSGSGYDIHTAAQAYSDGLFGDIEKLQEAMNGEFFLQELVSGVTVMLDPLLYTPSERQDREAYYDQEQYDVYNEQLKGVKCQLKDSVGEHVELSLSGDEVGHLQNTFEEKERGAAHGYLREYVDNNMTASFANWLGDIGSLHTPATEEYTEVPN